MRRRYEFWIRQLNIDPCFFRHKIIILKVDRDKRFLDRPLVNHKALVDILRKELCGKYETEDGERDKYGDDTGIYRVSGPYLFQFTYNIFLLILVGHG